jgi:hypothetical protein
LLAKKEAAKMLLRMSGATEADFKKLFRSKKITSLSDEVKELEKMIEEYKRDQQRNANNCADGQNCQRIVSEADLEAMLANGWHVAAVLPSGKIVISND